MSDDNIVELTCDNNVIATVHHDHVLYGSTKYTSMTKFRNATRQNGAKPVIVAVFRGMPVGKLHEFSWVSCEQPHEVIAHVEARYNEIMSNVERHACSDDIIKMFGALSLSEQKKCIVRFIDIMTKQNV